MPRRFLFLFGSVCLSVAFGQTPSDHLNAGTILLASENLTDPHFANTVVLITHRETSGEVMGLILNRPMDLSLAKAFPQLHASSADPVFDGGPVSSDAVQALLRSAEKPDTAEHILGDIYSVARKALLEKSISDRLPKSKFRVYLGYAGWGRGQLENEVRLGAWTVIHGDRYVFDGDPASLWDRLNREAHSQLALSRSHATMKACRCVSEPFFLPSSFLLELQLNPSLFSFFASKTALPMPN
jgi:putative transcriptional regulator